MSRSPSTESRNDEYSQHLATDYVPAAAAHYVTAAPEACEQAWPQPGMACTTIATPATATPAASSPASTTNEDYRFMTPNSVGHHGYDGLRGPPPTSIPAPLPLMGIGAGVGPMKMQDPADAGEWEYTTDGCGIQTILLNADEVSGYARSQTGSLGHPQFSGLPQPWVYSAAFQAQSPNM